MALNIDLIFVQNCNFRVLPYQDQKEIAYNLAITHFEKLDTQDPENANKQLFSVGFDLFHGVEKPAMELSCTYVAIYTGDTVEDFNILKDKIVVSHIIPYLREFIAGLTMRSVLPPLTIPPINTAMLLDDYETRKKAQQQQQKDQQAQE